MLTTPILFKVFNRPNCTRVVFDSIRKIRPVRLYVSQDGPRPGRADDAENCAAVRTIVEQVDWLCEVETLYEKENKGCRLSVACALIGFLIGSNTESFWRTTAYPIRRSTHFANICSTNIKTWNK